MNISQEQINQMLFQTMQYHAELSRDLVLEWSKSIPITASNLERVQAFNQLAVDAFQCAGLFLNKLAEEQQKMGINNPAIQQQRPPQANQ